MRGDLNVIRLLSSFIFVLVVPICGFAVEIPVMHSSSAKDIATSRSCQSIFQQLAQAMLTQPESGSQIFALEQTLPALETSFVTHYKLSAPQSALFKTRLKLITDGLADQPNYYLRQAVTAIHPKAGDTPHGGVPLWLCYGINCTTKKPEASGTVVPFNYIVAEHTQVPADADLSSRVANMGHKVPHPNIGLSRVENIFLPKPDFNSAASIDTWLVGLLGSVSEYASNQLISEFITKSLFAAKSGIASPLFQKFIRLNDRIYVIDPTFFRVVSAGSQAMAKEHALRLQGTLTTETASALKAEAFASVVSNTTLQGRADFESFTGRELTEASLYGVTRYVVEQMKSFNKKLNVTHSQPVYPDIYPDPVFGSMPMAVEIVN